jgi:hypothetical protein
MDREFCVICEAPLEDSDVSDMCESCDWDNFDDFDEDFLEDNCE